MTDPDAPTRDAGGALGVGTGPPRGDHSRVARRWAVIFAVEAVLVAGYFALTEARVTQPRLVVYPFVWINAGIWAVARTAVPSAPRRHRLLAGVVAGGYFLVLLWLAGLVGLTHHGGGVTGLRVATASPGWGPVVSYLGPTVHATFVPFRVLGYLALAHLVYARTLEAASAVLSGVLGFVSCISCSFSIITSLVASLGGSSGIAAAVYSLSVDASTAVFLLAVGLLYWGPRLSRRVASG